MELAARLVHAGILDRAEAQAALKEREAVREQIAAPSLVELLVRRGLLTRTEMSIFRDRPLEEIQPFPKYVIHRKVAEGGMSQVYKATYKPLGVTVALKVMKPEVSRQERFLLRFKREAGILMRLEHPNIVRGYDLAEQERVWYCAMDFAEGKNLQDEVEARGRLTVAKALRATVQIARALVYLDSRGIVHRDVKPGNVVVSEDGTARIIDLGLCLLRGGMREDGAAGTTVGTVQYISPEQARGRDDVDGRSDLYALGGTLHQLLTGEIPFPGKTDEEILVRQVLSDFHPARLEKAGVPDKVRALVVRLLEKDRDRRPASAVALVVEMEETWPALAPVAPAPIAAPAPAPAPAPGKGAPKPTSDPALPKLVSKKEREEEGEERRKPKRVPPPGRGEKSRPPKARP